MPRNPDDPTQDPDDSRSDWIAELARVRDQIAEAKDRLERLYGHEKRIIRVLYPPDEKTDYARSVH